MDDVIKALEECSEMLRNPGAEEAALARKTIAACVDRLEELKAEQRRPETT